MTFSEIVNSVADTVNATSTEAQSRIGRRVNERYRRAATSLGINLAALSSITAETVSGNPLVTVSAEKVITVRDKTANRVLDEVSIDQIRNLDADDSESGPPTRFAVITAGASTVVVRLHPTPADVRTLDIDANVTKATLTGIDVPAFAASFHDVLLYGALADESRKIDKRQANEYERQFEQRLSDLRFYLAKSSYLHLHQGQQTRRPWQRY